MTTRLVEDSIYLENKLFENNYIRIFTLLFAGIMIGYILQPVPRWINNLFNGSLLFKFFILFISGSIALYPLDKYKIVLIITCSFGILLVFHLARKIDDIVDRIEERKRKKKEKGK